MLQSTGITGIYLHTQWQVHTELCRIQIGIPAPPSLFPSQNCRKRLQSCLEWSGLCLSPPTPWPTSSLVSVHLPLSAGACGTAGQSPGFPSGAASGAPWQMAVGGMRSESPCHSLALPPGCSPCSLGCSPVCSCPQFSDRLLLVHWAACFWDSTLPLFLVGFRDLVQVSAQHSQRNLPGVV